MGGGLPRRIALQTEALGIERFPKFTLRRIRYRSQRDRTSTLLLAQPRRAGRVPLLVALHGHEATWGEADAGAFRAGHADDFCAYFAERGWAVLQPATMNHTRQRVDWTLQGEWTWDAMRALDYALTQPGIDRSRVAVCGLSTGGHLALNLLALDDRVQAGIVGCVVSTWHHYECRMRFPPHCDCGIAAQLGGRLEQCDWLALAAPKPVQVQHGTQDSGFGPGVAAAKLDLTWNNSVMPREEFATTWAEATRAYQRRPDALRLHIHGGGHQVDAAAAFRFLEAWA